MPRRILASLMAGALALAGLAGGPAQAGDERDIARILAGTAALVIIGRRSRTAAGTMTGALS